MKVQNIKSGDIFETSRAEFESTIVSQGLSHKYKVLDDGAPLEIKNMREKKTKEVPLELKKEGESKLIEVNEPISKKK